MKHYLKYMSLGAALMGGFAGNALALTKAGDTVANTAVLEYSNGTTDYTLESSPDGNSTTGTGNGTSTDFVVDRRLDVEVVASAGSVSVTAGTDDNIMQFEVTNNGNDTHGVELTLVKDTVNFTEAAGTEPNNGADNADMASVELCVDGNDNDTIDVGECSVTTTSTIASMDYSSIPTPTLVPLSPSSVTVWVRADAPGTLADGDRAVYSLVAQPRDGTGVVTSDTTTNDDTTVENVFAEGIGDIHADGTTPDADHDGQHSDSTVFIVAAPDLTVTKTSETVWDEFSCTESAPGADSTADVTPALCAAGNPRAIPGSYTRYTIKVENAGTGNTSFDISDTVDTDTQIQTGSVVVENGEGTAVTPTASSVSATAIALDGIAIPAANASDATDEIYITFFVVVQ